MFSLRHTPTTGTVIASLAGLAGLDGTGRATTKLPREGIAAAVSFSSSSFPAGISPI